MEESPVCSIAAVYGHPKAAHLTFALLNELSNRGQGARGIAVSDGGNPYIRREESGKMLHDLSNPQKLYGHIALGHGRYATSGSESSAVDTQPAYADGIGFRIVLVENGDTPVLQELREQFPDLDSNTEAEVIARILVRDLEGGTAMLDALRRLQETYDGAFSLIILHGDRLYAATDLHGMRPLFIGDAPRNHTERYYAVASEDEPLRSINLGTIRELEPGEIVEIGPHGIHWHSPEGLVSPAHCLFELDYFAGVSSRVFGVEVAGYRYTVGRILGERLRSQHLRIDGVAPIPDSSNPFGEGLAEGLGVPLTFGIIRIHRQRTFIGPQRSRRKDVRKKFRVNRFRMRGRHILLADDSIVRGLTMSVLAQIARSANPGSLHLAVCFPPLLWPCYYGIDMKREEDFGARPFLRPDGTVDAAQFANRLGLSSLTYATLQDQYTALTELGVRPEHFCAACISGAYPTPAGQQKANLLFAQSPRQ